MEYSSGHTFRVLPDEVDPNDTGARQLASGWYAQWAEDCDTGEVSGPFATEDEAARIFLAE